MFSSVKTEVLGQGQERAEMVTKGQRVETHSDFWIW